MEEYSEEYEHTLEEDVMEWIWAVYPELYNEYEEHLHKVRDIILKYLVGRDVSDIDVYSERLQKMLEKRFYFLGGCEKVDSIRVEFWN